MTLQLHEPDGQGGLEPQAQTPQDWREQLESPRWNPPPLKNTEMNPTRTWVSVVFWGALAALTFVLLLVGYGTGFWG
jgi:hypothetical protein